EVRSRRRPCQPGPSGGGETAHRLAEEWAGRCEIPLEKAEPVAGPALALTDIPMPGIARRGDPIGTAGLAADEAAGVQRPSRQARCHPRQGQNRDEHTEFHSPLHAALLRAMN